MREGLIKVNNAVINGSGHLLRAFKGKSMTRTYEINHSNREGKVFHSSLENFFL